MHKESDTGQEKDFKNVYTTSNLKYLIKCKNKWDRQALYIYNVIYQQNDGTLTELEKTCLVIDFRPRI